MAKTKQKHTHKVLGFYFYNIYPPPPPKIMSNITIEKKNTSTITHSEKYCLIIIMVLLDAN